MGKCTYGRMGTFVGDFLDWGTRQLRKQPPTLMDRAMTPRLPPAIPRTNSPVATAPSPVASGGGGGSRPTGARSLGAKRRRVSETRNNPEVASPPRGRRRSTGNSNSATSSTATTTTAATTTAAAASASATDATAHGGKKMPMPACRAVATGGEGSAASESRRQIGSSLLTARGTRIMTLRPGSAACLRERARTVPARSRHSSFSCSPRRPGMIRLLRTGLGLQDVGVAGRSPGVRSSTTLLSGGSGAGAGGSGVPLGQQERERQQHAVDAGQHLASARKKADHNRSRGRSRSLNSRETSIRAVASGASRTSWGGARGGAGSRSKRASYDGTDSSACETSEDPPSRNDGCVGGQARRRRGRRGSGVSDATDIDGDGGGTECVRSPSPHHRSSYHPSSSPSRLDERRSQRDHGSGNAGSTTSSASEDWTSSSDVDNFRDVEAIPRRWAFGRGAAKVGRTRDPRAIRAAVAIEEARANPRRGTRNQAELFRGDQVVLMKKVP